MTITLELSPEIEARLQTKAQRDGRTLPDYLRLLAERDAQMPPREIADAEVAHGENEAAKIARRLAAINEIFAGSATRKAPPLNLPGPRADVYSYTAREDEQL